MWTDASSTVGAYAAGFLEGYLTQDLTWAFRHNFFSGNSLNTTYSAAGSSATDKAAAFLEANFAWVQSQIAAHAAIDNSAYWQQINLEYTQVWPCDVFVVALVVCRITADVAFGGLVWCSWLQLAGMVAGYNSAAPAGQELTHTDFLFMNSQVRRRMLRLRGASRWGRHTSPPPCSRAWCCRVPQGDIGDIQQAVLPDCMRDHPLNMSFADVRATHGVLSLEGRSTCAWLSHG